MKLSSIIKTIVVSICCAALIGFSAWPAVATVVGFDPHTTDAVNFDRSLGDVSLGKANPTLVAVNLINAALTLLALVCVILLVYAGFLWVWARGNQEEVKKSKDIILGTVIGLVIVLSALGITTFVFQTVGDVTGATVTT